MIEGPLDVWCRGALALRCHTVGSEINADIYIRDIQLSMLAGYPFHRDLIKRLDFYIVREPAKHSS